MAETAAGVAGLLATTEAAGSSATTAAEATAVGTTVTTLATLATGRAAAGDVTDLAALVALLATARGAVAGRTTSRLGALARDVANLATWKINRQYFVLLCSRCGAAVAELHRCTAAVTWRLCDVQSRAGSVWIIGVLTSVAGLLLLGVLALARQVTLATAAVFPRQFLFCFSSSFSGGNSAME